MTNLTTMQNFTFTDEEVSFLTEQCEAKNGVIIELSNQLRAAKEQNAELLALVEALTSENRMLRGIGDLVEDGE